MSVTSLARTLFGTPSKVKTGKAVLVGRLDGCMAEKFTPLYEGTISGKTSIPCHSSKGMISLPGISITVTQSHDSTHKRGDTATELSEHLRTLEDGRLVIAL